MRDDAGLSRRLTTAAWCAILVLGVSAPWLISAYELNLLARFLALSLVALGLVLLWGEGGVLSLGQGVFFGLGGYAIAMNLKLATLAPGDVPDFMTWSGGDSLPWWWVPFRNPAFAVAAAILAPSLLAALFSWLMFRRRIGGVYFALITQALALSFSTLLISQQPSTGGFNGLTDFQTFFGFDLNAPLVIRALYWLTLALVAFGVLALRWLLGTRYGKLLRAIRDGENRVRFLGFDPTPYKVLAFTLAAAFASLGGALFTIHAGVISPALAGVVPSIEMIVWVAVGGRRSLLGAVSGALVVNFAKDQISSAFPSAWLYILGLAFILVVTFLPDGFAGFMNDAAAMLGRLRKTEKKEIDAVSPGRPARAGEVK